MVDYLMDVLNNKFELPFSKEELRRKQADERLNINTSDRAKIGNSFKDLKELDVSNKIEQPIASVRKTPEPPPTPKKPVAKPAPTPTVNREPEAKPEPVPAPTPPSRTEEAKPKPAPTLTEDTESKPTTSPPATPVPITEESMPEPIPTKKPKPSSHKEAIKKTMEEEEEEETKRFSKNIDLQFKWGERPEGLKNMPQDASNLDMLKSGAGPDNLEGGGWQRAWSILDIFDEADDMYIHETLKGSFNRVEGNKTTMTFASAGEGIFKRQGEEWTKIGENAGSGNVTRLNVLNNNLLRTRSRTETGSPVDIYNIDEDTWSSYAGDVPFDEVGPYTGDWVVNSCIHNGELYLASAYYIWKSTIVDGTRVWSKFYDGIIGHNDRDGVPLIDDITSDGNDIFIIAGMNYFPIGGYATEIFKVTATDYTKLAKISDNRKPSTLDYESYTEKLYASTTDDPATKIFRMGTDGTTEDLMTLDDKYYYTGVATGSMFGYLSAGKKIYRLGKDQDPTEIYSSDARWGQRYLTSYEEQIGIGANGKIFHTEMEGSVVRAVRRGEDSKYPT